MPFITLIRYTFNIILCAYLRIPIQLYNSCEEVTTGVLRGGSARRQLRVYEIVKFLQFFQEFVTVIFLFHNRFYILQLKYVVMARYPFSIKLLPKSTLFYRPIRVFIEPHNTFKNNYEYN